MQKDLCEKCVKRRDRIRELNRGKRPEHSPDFASGQIEEIDRLRAEGQACECWIRHRDLARMGKSEAPGDCDWLFQKRPAETKTPVLRYDLCIGAECNGGMAKKPYPDGTWVRYEDIKAVVEGLPGWEALEYAARTLESAEQSLRQMGAYGNADILHPAAVWLRSLEQQAQEKRHG